MYSCYNAALKGDLSLLTEGHCKGHYFDKNVCINSAKNGHLNCLEYAIKHGCQFDEEETITYAAKHGQLEIVKYLREKINCKWNEYVCYYSIFANSPECLKYAIENGCPHDKNTLLTWEKAYGYTWVSDYIMRCKSKIEAMKLYLQFPNYKIRKEEDYWILEKKKTDDEILDGTILKIEEIEYDGYVYDLETENHHFHAGPGVLVVHNTDSVYIKFNTEKKEDSEMRKDSLRVGYECAQMITNSFPKPMELELEKIYHPFLILAKKRYKGFSYEPWDPSNPDSLPDEPEEDVKGIVLKRRDNCHFLKLVYGGMLDKLMKDKSKDIAIAYIKKLMDDLVNGKIDMKELIITKKLSNDYKNPDSQAHWVLTQKIKKRDPGSEAKSNDRVPYVFVHVPIGKKKKTLQGDIVEDPNWVKSHPSIKIDYAYYVEKQLKKPCVDVLEFIIPKKEAEEIFNYYIRKDTNAYLKTGKLSGGQRRITDFI